MSEYKTTLQRREDSLLDFVNSYSDEVEALVALVEEYRANEPALYSALAKDVTAVVDLYNWKRSDK